MNGNSSKQVLLSVLGIAVLVVAVVGVSFAFFTYSRNGETNNVLTTGSVIFRFLDSHDIILTDQFPVSDAEGSSLSHVGDATGSKNLKASDNPVMDFSVVGYDGSGKGISYTVTAHQGLDDADATKSRLLDNEVKLLLTASSSNGSTITNNYSSPAIVGTPNSLASTDGVTLATGRITATQESAQQTDSFTLRMWIAEYDSTSGTGCQVISGDNATDNAATHAYTTATFAKKYYSLRVDVDAATTTTP